MMKKRNILTVALSLSLVGVIAVGGTLAYFTDQAETKVNAFTTGKVDIVLHDTSPEMDGMVSGTEKPEGGIEYDNIVPGDELSKDVSVSVIHDSAPTRLAVLVTVENTKGTAKPADEELLNRDYYFILADLEAFTKAIHDAEKDYLDKDVWAKKAINNVARIGNFSSDRAVLEYADRIWHVKPV